MLKEIIKKKIIILLVILIVFISPVLVYARAGGGSSSGSGGGGTSGGSAGGTSHSSVNRNTNPIGAIINYTLIIIVSCSGIIVARARLIKVKRKTRKKIRETTWNYKELEQRVIDAYFLIQEAWAENDLSIAEDYMDPCLLENFQIKLNWLEIANKKNILKNIKLLEAYPISLVDEVEDINDRIWVYIKGKMIDYTINTATNEVIDGSTISKSFVEYWLFSKNKDGNWVLKKILQEDEIDRIPLEV